MEPVFLGDPSGFGIQVVQNLDVVAYESERHDDRVAHASACQPNEGVPDVGLQPRDVRRTAAALVGDRPGRAVHAAGYQARALVHLAGVGRAARRPGRQAVRGEDDVRLGPPVLRQPRQRRGRAVGQRGDE